MICKKCNSSNVKVEARKVDKAGFVTAFAMLFCGLGTMFGGLLVGIIAAILGAIVGLIVKLIVPDRYESHAICQDCGAHWKIDVKKAKKK